MSDLREQLQQSLGDGFALERELGGGGMSRVFLALERRFGRHVVVKVLEPDLAAGLNVVRFEREVLMAAQLQHANIVTLLSAGDAHGLPYYTMPFIHGESLRARMLRGPVPMNEVVSVLRDVARALAYAHSRTVIHRDIKPENVLLSGNAALVSDFGIAKAVWSAQAQSGISGLTMAGSYIGTPAYMPPEQAVGDAVDERADVYSWGVVAYEMIAGRHPFSECASGQQFVQAHLTETPADIGIERPDANATLNAVVMQCLVKQREGRPRNGSEVLQLLEDAVATVTPGHLRDGLNVTPTSMPSTTSMSSIATSSAASSPATASSASASLPSPASRRWRTVSIAAAVMLLVILGITQRDRFASDDSRAANNIALEKSIAVLPFLNMSTDKEQEYFSDGLTEELIKLLAKSTDMRVAARTSAFRFKGEKIDVRDVAKRLSVAYVLEGSVQKAGNTIRVTAQLIKAADGKSIWSDSYDRQLNDIFAVQDEIADKAVKALKTTLLANALVSNARPRNVESYNLVLQGRYFLANRTQETVARAIGCFQQALIAEPRNAAAFVGLSRAYRVQAGQGWLPVVDGYGLSRDAAQKAIAIDSQLAEAHEALAYVQSVFDWDWDAAQASYQRAIALEPGNADVLRSAALLSGKLGRFDEAIAGLNNAIERDPLLSSAYSDLSFMLGAKDRWVEAEAVARKALDLSPNGILRHFNIGRALLFQGKADAALAEMQMEKDESWHLMGLSLVYHALNRGAASDSALAEYETKNASHAAMQIADIHAYRGDVNQAFTWLERANAQRDAGMADLKDDPWLKGIAKDARFKALMTRMKLPQ